ncbi:unnamed protein product [Linum trigynum]|uniref:Trichome birefringence-like C-terminal domain-containing protein n=1 Tax=Linum trigynum TaxID=586398 RepID=A0AAV2CIU7_9ROSI
MLFRIVSYSLNGFMRWRWKPDGSDLPIFNPAQFLEIVRGKSLAFVGDSVGRNQIQSLICLLSRPAGRSRRYHSRHGCFW